MTDQATVCIVSGDYFMRRQVQSLTAVLKMNSMVFDSADAFLKSAVNNRPGCVLADDLMLAEQLQQNLPPFPTSLPLIVTGRGLDVDTAVRFMENGAFTTLELPCAMDRLAKAINAAVLCDKNWLPRLRRFEELQRIEQSLTDRKREVLALLEKGASNKAIAAELKVPLSTVEMHRAQTIQKFGVRTALELVASYTELRVLADTVFQTKTTTDLRLRLAKKIRDPDSP